MRDLVQMQRFQIEALQKENERLNNQIREFKALALKATLSDPNFDKKLSEIETDFEIIEPIKN